MWLAVRIKRFSSESKHGPLEVNEKEKFRDLLFRVSATSSPARGRGWCFRYQR